MPKYQLDALRAIRSMQQSHEIAGHGPMAERMRAIGDQVEAMVKALKAIANLYWQDAPAPEEMREIARKALGVKG